MPLAFRGATSVNLAVRSRVADPGGERIRVTDLTRLMVLALALALALSAAAAAAQEGRPPWSVAVTSAASGSDALSGVRETMARMEAEGRLRLVSRLADGRLPGRVHEYFEQFHRGVPVYGGGLSLQREGEATVSILGAVHRDIDVAPLPRLSAAEAVVRATELAGVGPAGAAPPALTVLPTPLGGYALAWRLVMRDMNAWFIDAGTGEPVARHDLVNRQQGIAVGSGIGAFGERRKVSVTKVSRGLTGEAFETRDRLRGAEIVTLDMGGDGGKLERLLAPEETWGPADVAFDPDNDWDPPAVVDVHAHMGFLYDYLRREQGWRGLDGNDGRIVVATNLPGFENAFWAPPPFGFEGTGALVFGGLGFFDADPDGPDNFGVLDIVGHEAMHGVTYFSVHRRTGSRFANAHTWVPGPKRISIAGREFGCDDVWPFPEGPTGPFLCEKDRFLLFLDESGAINEAMSDILGTAVEFAFHPPGEGPLRADYAIGEDVAPVRVIDDPGAAELVDGVVYPDAMDGVFRFPVALIGEGMIRYTGIVFREGEPIGYLESGDYSGVHWNSTPLSHSFFLAVEGGRHRSSGATVTGAGGANRDRVARIYFRALTELMPARGTFETMAAAVSQSAVDLYGDESAEYAAVHRALTAVGLSSR